MPVFGGLWQKLLKTCRAGRMLFWQASLIIGISLEMLREITDIFPTL